MTTPTITLQILAHTATQHLLTQTPMEVVHPPAWERNGFPLPIKKGTPEPDGTLRQTYRPLAVLEYVHECLSGEMQARRKRDAV